MKLFSKAQKTRPIPEGEEPVLQVSICTGETTAGFYNKATGKTTGVCLIRDEEDLKEFKKTYGITGDIRKVY